MKKIVLITGASSGFGKATAERLLAQRNCIVYATARRTEPMQSLADNGARVLSMDVTKDEDVNKVVEQILREENRIDVLIANAGFGAYGFVECVSMEDIKYQYEVNVFGVARCLHAVLPAMRKQRHGKIIITESLVSNVSLMGLGWYASTKHALKGMSKALRQELKPFGIEVATIEPGAVKTGFRDVAVPSMLAKELPEDYQQAQKNFCELIDTSYKAASSDESTVKAIVSAVNNRSPKAVYRTTIDSKLSFLLGFIPVKMFDFIVRESFKHS